MDQTLIDGVVDATRRVLEGGAISANGHGNVSLRQPGADEMYFTSASSLHGLGPDGIARVGLDNCLREGQLPPIQGAVVAMHTALYQHHQDVGCVIHTHSPYATAFAVANRPIDCWIEALAMFGLPDGVPLAGYGPRGPTRPWRTSWPRSSPAFPRSCSPTTVSWCSIARPSSRSSSAGSWRKRPAPRSTPRRSVDPW
jgi:ribulose-5-phosphate 4-epimerase/fuculose-1-phosphate aldolase